jgi:hypothetical protein
LKAHPDIEIATTTVMNRFLWADQMKSPNRAAIAHFEMKA